jgi:hypothetical protein
MQCYGASIGTVAKGEKMIFDTRLVEDVYAEFSGSLAKREVERISQFHRIQASPGFHEAAKYVLGRLWEIGVKAKMHRFHSDGAKKYFTWTSPVGWEGTSATLEMLEPERKVLARFPEVPCSLAAHSKPADIEAEVIDVETGLTPQEYEGKDVKGKVVLACRRTAEVYREAMLNQGAAGILSYLADRPEEPDMVPYNALWPKKKEMKKVGFGFSLSRRTALHLKSLLASGKKVKVRAKVNARLYSSKLDVVAAEFPGKGPAVLFIAHLCHPQPGANDNASGAAALVEMARTLKSLVSSGKVKLRRPVRFMWVPEMYGTIAFLHSHPEYAASTLCCINLDMVGENEAACRSKLRLTQTPWSVPSYLADLMLEALDATDKGVKPDPCGSQNLFHFEQTGYSGGSDHYVFLESTWGVPSVMVGHWPDMFYHTHADTPERTDATELARVGSASLIAGLYAANAGADEATALSVAVEGHAHTRLSALVAHRFDRLRSCRKGELLSQFHRFRRHIELALRREERAVYSVMELSRSSSLKHYLENAEFTLASREVAAIARMEQYVREKLNMRGDLPVPRATAAQKRLAKAVPKRLFGGPLAFDVLREEPQKDSYYREVMQKDDTNGQRLYETVNLMDGKRSLLDIHEVVDAQFPFFDMELLGRFVSDLEEAGLVRVRRARR